MNTDTHPGNRTALFLGLACITLALACEHDMDQPSTTRTTGAVLMKDDAVVQIAKARCEREAECNIFDSQSYSNKKECVTEYQTSTRRRAGMDLDTCPHGVDKARLDKCVAALRDERCEQHMGQVVDMSECSRSMCAR
jgi:hypothetical protein